MRDRIRTLVGASALGLALLALSPAVAEIDRKAETRIVIKRVGAGSDVTIDGVDVAELRRTCQGQGAESDVVTDEDGHRTRTKVVVCNKDGTRDRASLLSALEKAKRELATGDHLGTRHRDRAVAALDAEVARVRLGQ